MKYVLFYDAGADRPERKAQKRQRSPGASHLHLMLWLYLSPDSQMQVDPVGECIRPRPWTRRRGNVR